MSSQPSTSSAAVDSPSAVVAASGPTSTTTTVSDAPDELVLPNMVPAKPGSDRLFYYAFPPWPHVPGMLRIDQFEPQGLANQSWPAGSSKPEPADDDDDDAASDDSDDDDEDAPCGRDGSGVPTVHLNIEHFLDRKKERKHRSGSRKNRKPKAPRLQMRRKGIVRTEDLFGPGGWEGNELVETRGSEPYDVTTPALLRIQRAAREYASSRVHVINADQPVMQIWANFLAFSQLEKRPEAERQEFEDDDLDDDDSDGVPEDGRIMCHSEAGLDDEPEPTSRLLDDMVGTVRMFLSSVYRNRGLHWHDGQLDAGPHVVWSFIKYVKAHGVLPETAFVPIFQQVQAVCEQARTEMRLTKATPLVFEDGFNLVCSRVWGKSVNEGISRPWVLESQEAEALLAGSDLSSPYETVAGTHEAAGNSAGTAPAVNAGSSLGDVEEPLVDVLEPAQPAGTTYEMITGSDDGSGDDESGGGSLVSPPAPSTPALDGDGNTALEWGAPTATPDVVLAAAASNAWDPASLPAGWELEWDVSEYTTCKPTTFLDGIFAGDGGSVHGSVADDGAWAVAAEQERLMRIVAVGQAALVGRPEVDEHFLFANAGGHALAPVVLESWTPTPEPFASRKSQAETPIPAEALLPAHTEGAARELVVWIEQTVADEGKVKAGMGIVAALKWIRRAADGRAFWFVDSVPEVISDFYLALPASDPSSAPPA